MEDIDKAIVMSVQALMFILALTIAAVMYFKINANIRDVIAETDFSNRGDAITDVEGEDTTRKIKRAELITAVLNLGDGGITSVKIGGYEFTSDASDPNIIHYGLSSYDKNHDPGLKALLNTACPSPAYVYELQNFTDHSLEYVKVGP